MESRSIARPSLETRPARGLRCLAAALAPFVALALQSLLWPHISPYPWTLFYPAVFVSSWLGGPLVGVGATAVSMVLAAWFFVPPELSLALGQPGHLAPAGVFFVTGVLVSLLQQKLLQANRLAARASAERAAAEARGMLGERFQRLFEDAPEGIFVADSDGRCTEVNRAGCDLVGASREEVVGRPIADLVPPEDAERLCRIREQLLAGGRPVAEWRLRRKDGTIVPVEASASIHADGRWQAFLHDITARKKAERAQELLARAWETLASSLDYRETLQRVARLAIDLLGDVCTIDLMEKDGSVRRVVALHADPARAELAEELARLAPVRHFPSPFWTVVDTRRALLLADFSAEALQGAAQNDEHRRVLEALGIRSVLAVPLISRGHLLAVFIIASCRPDRRYDANDLRLAEDLARRAALAVDNVHLYQESCFQAAVTANLAEGVQMVCAANSTIVYTNARFEKMFGYGPAELIGRPVHTLNAPGEVPPSEKAAQIIGTLSREGRWRGEIENVKKDGTRFWCYASVALFEHPELGPVWIDVHKDITERKRLEETNARSLQEKEVLLKEVHHRVKNNLQVISSLFYLQQQRAEDGQIKSLLNESRSRVQSIALIHEQLYQSTSLAVIDLDDYLRRLIVALRSTYGAGRVEIETGAAGVVLDLEHAFPCALLISELVSNALKHAFAGRTGKLWARACRAADREIVLDVGDDGAGIPESLDWRNTGSLGLQLVQSLVRQLRGSIELDRSAGARFTIRFQSP
jgi:PAS domain S-box-containing protein